jgi:hypothetical protein
MLWYSLSGVYMDRNNSSSIKHIHTHRQHLQWVGILVIVSLWVLVSAACGISGPPSKSIQQISDPDLVGIWESHYSPHDGVEFLIIKDDRTYQQIFEDASGYLYVGEIYNWYLEPSTSGRLFVRFENGRYFPEGPDFAGLLGSDPLDRSHLYPFYDPESGGAVYMDKELMLEVFSSHNPRGVTLGQFPSDIDAGREYFSPVAP